MWLLGAHADLLGSYQRCWKRSLYSRCSFADKPNVCIFIYLFFLQLTFPIPSLQSKRVHVSFINCAKAACNNLGEFSPEAYHLVWTLASAIAGLISNHAYRSPTLPSLLPQPPGLSAFSYIGIFTGPSSFLPPGTFFLECSSASSSAGFWLLRRTWLTQYLLYWTCSANLCFFCPVFLRYCLPCSSTECLVLSAGV